MRNHENSGTAVCHTCELIARRDAGAAPLWDNIYRTDHWDVVHSYNSSLPGWLVLVTRRHLTAVDEMTDDEALELGRLLRDISHALRAVTGCEKSYVMQFAEHPRHPHVHFHIVPRMKQQPENRRGPNVMAYLGAAQDDRVDEETMNELGAQIGKRLQRIERAR